MEETVEMYSGDSGEALADLAAESHPVKNHWPVKHQTPHAELALICCSNKQPGNRNVLYPSEGKNLCCKQTAHHSLALPPCSWQSCSWPHATLRTNTEEVSSARLSSNKDVFMACLRKGKKKKNRHEIQRLGSAGNQPSGQRILLPETLQMLLAPGLLPTILPTILPVPNPEPSWGV